MMITGDHVDTAFAIGKQLGIVSRMEQCMTGEQLEQTKEEAFLERLDDTRVFARVSPRPEGENCKGLSEKRGRSWP